MNNDRLLALKSRAYDLMAFIQTAQRELGETNQAILVEIQKGEAEQKTATPETQPVEPEAEQKPEGTE